MLARLSGKVDADLLKERVLEPRDSRTISFTLSVQRRAKRVLLFAASVVAQRATHLQGMYRNETEKVQNGEENERRVSE